MKWQRKLCQECVDTKRGVLAKWQVGSTPLPKD